MTYSKTESRLAFAFFATIFLSRLYQGLTAYGFVIDNAHADPHLLSEKLLPQLAMILAAYGAFASLNFYVLPRYWTAKRYHQALAGVFIVFVVAGLIFTAAQSYISSWIYKQYDNVFIANVKFFSRGFAMVAMGFMAYGIYLLVRAAIVYQYQLHLLKQTLATKVSREAVIVIAAWILMLVLMILTIPREFFYTFGSFYVFALPFCFILYFLNLYWLIPLREKGSAGWRWGYGFMVAGVSVALGAIELAFLLQSKPSLTLGQYASYYWLLPLMITLALSWWIYLSNRETYRQLTALKSALGSTDANLQFLRSQINPHFLFNALNTLYGTALTEGAERTSEGIQKLGDMMRFMLHENMQELIPLSHDIEYLRNYIELQNLRIALSDTIHIKADIANALPDQQIAPMLLIPFIENAYKHGISLRHPSYINISVLIEPGRLLLDVHNSKHKITHNDPEQAHSGIGLQNVKQRLQLLYPNRHDLQIQETNDDFFIHLTLNLS